MTLSTDGELEMHDRRVAIQQMRGAGKHNSDIARTLGMKLNSLNSYIRRHKLAEGDDRRFKENSVSYRPKRHRHAPFSFTPYVQPGHVLGGNNGGAVRFVDRLHDECCWPTWKSAEDVPNVADRMVCGAVIEPDAPGRGDAYCRTHRALNTRTA